MGDVLANVLSLRRFGAATAFGKEGKPSAMPPKVKGLDMQLPAVPDGGLEDTISRMETTMITGGVAISQTRGLTVDGASIAGERGALRRSDIVLEGVLGSGACSVVRLARGVADGRLYAVKVFNVFEDAKRHQLVKEVRTLFALNCEALVSFHGAYLDDGGRVGVVLDFMDAGALEDVLKQRARQRRDAPGLPESACAAILYQTFWGLAYLHYEQRLHRDIKPGNILVTFRGEAKLSDFGIARDVDEEDAIATTMVGTFRYMSPERLLGGDYSFESDVWSVGMVLLEAARGRPVFPPNCTPVDLTQAFNEAAMARLVADALLGADASENMGQFAEACLAYEAAERALPDDLLAGPWFQDAALWGGRAPSIEAARDALAPFLADHAAETAAARERAAANAVPPPPPPPEEDSARCDAADMSLMQTMCGSSDDDDDDDGGEDRLEATFEDSDEDRD